MQSAGHTLGRGFHAPNSEVEADSLRAVHPAHIMDAGAGWSPLLRPHPRQWCSHC